METYEAAVAAREAADLSVEDARLALLQYKNTAGTRSRDLQAARVNAQQKEELAVEVRKVEEAALELLPRTRNPALLDAVFTLKEEAWQAHEAAQTAGRALNRLEMYETNNPDATDDLQRRLDNLKSAAGMRKYEEDSARRAMEQQQARVKQHISQLAHRAIQAVKRRMSAERKAEATAREAEAERRLEASHDLRTPAAWDTTGSNFSIDAQGRWWLKYYQHEEPFEVSMGFRDRRHCLRFNGGNLSLFWGQCDAPACLSSKEREKFCKPISVKHALVKGRWPYGPPATAYRYFVSPDDDDKPVILEALHDDAVRWLLFMHMPEMEGDPSNNKDGIEPRKFFPYPARRQSLLGDFSMRGLPALMSLYGRRGFKEWIDVWKHNQLCARADQQELKRKLTDMRDGKEDLANAKKLCVWKREQENAEKAAAARAKAEAQAEDGVDLEDADSDDEDDEDEDGDADETKPELPVPEVWQQQLSYVYTMPGVQDHIANHGNMTTMSAWRKHLKKYDLVPEYLKGKRWHLCHILARKLGGMVHPANLFLAPCKVNWHFRIYFCEAWEQYVGPEAWKGAIAFNCYINLRTSSARAHACAEYVSNMRSCVHQCN